MDIIKFFGFEEKNKTDISDIGEFKRDTISILDSILNRLKSIEDTINADELNSLDAILLTVLPPTTIYVDGTRTDTYTEQGSSTKPFKTVQAAVNKVNVYNDSRNYNIKITMFDYNETITIGIGVHNICFDADGIGQVHLNGLIINNHSSLNNCTFKNICFDASINIQNIVSDSIVFENCKFNYIINSNTTAIYYDNCYFSNDTFYIQNCAIIGIHNSTIGSDITIETDENAQVPPSFGFGTRVVLENCRVNSDTEFILSNIVEFLATTLELMNCIYGVLGHNIPNEANLVAWNSCLRGNYSGHRTLHNSVIVP